MARGIPFSDAVESSFFVIPDPPLQQFTDAVQAPLSTLFGEETFVRLDVFFLISTLLVFFSLIEVLVTTILDNNQQIARAKKLDRYCRVIVPVIFVSVSIAIFAHQRG